MAKKEHLAILRRGPEAWNKWRAANLDISPELGGVDLRGADLRGVDLSRARLARADLDKANLLGAGLRTADLTGSSLNRANLSTANLNMANLERVSLREANLSGANLRGAILTWSRLDGADLSGAWLGETTLDGASLDNSRMVLTTLVNVDLSNARGLDSICHLGPSSVGIDTIYSSRGRISDAFLRGAGVPESFIVQVKALVAAMEPIEFYSCFLSHSSKDHEFAKRLYADLRNENVRCWFAPEDMKIGDRIRPSIDEAIRVYDKLLLVLTKNSVSSAWVEKEVETAFEKEQKQGRTVLFPIRLDDAVMETEEAWAADIRRTRHIGDFCGWKGHDKYKKAFEKLMRDLKAEQQP